MWRQMLLWTILIFNTSFAAKRPHTKKYRPDMRYIINKNDGRLIENRSNRRNLDNSFDKRFKSNKSSDNQKIKYLEDKINKLEKIITQIDSFEYFPGIKTLSINNDIKVTDTTTKNIIYKMDELVTNVPEYIFTSNNKITNIRDSTRTISTPCEVTCILYNKCSCGGNHPTIKYYQEIDELCGDNPYLSEPNIKTKIKSIYSIILTKNYIIMFYKTNSNKIVWEAIYSDLLHKTDNNYIISHNLIQYGFNIPQRQQDGNARWSTPERLSPDVLDYRLKNQPIHIIFDTEHNTGTYAIPHTVPIQDKPY